MSLERQQLREELVAIIAAGRELSPDHDHFLADIYLSRAHPHHPTPPQSPVARWLGDPRLLRTLLAAACLALAVLALSLLAFHGAEARSESNGGAVVPQSIDRDGLHDGPGAWWYPPSSGEYPGFGGGNVTP